LAVIPPLVLRCSTTRSTLLVLGEDRAIEAAVEVVGDRDRLVESPLDAGTLPRGYQWAVRGRGVERMADNERVSNVAQRVDDMSYRDRGARTRLKCWLALWVAYSRCR
jgi:hypothetical protein